MTSSDMKQERMQARRTIGNRVLRPIAESPRRMAAPYLVAHACFVCRKSFKVHASDGARTCPQCSGALHEMGRSFKAPPHDDEEQWEKVQTLFAHGFRFFGNGNGDCERLPARLRDVEAFIARNTKHRLRIAPFNPELLPR